MMHFLLSGWKTVPCVNISALQNTRVRTGKKGVIKRKDHVWIMFVHLISREVVLFHFHSSTCYTKSISLIYYDLWLCTGLCVDFRAHMCECP